MGECPTPIMTDGRRRCLLNAARREEYGLSKKSIWVGRSLPLERYC